MGQENAWESIQDYYFDIKKEQRNDDFVELSYRKGQMRWNSILEKIKKVEELSKKKNMDFPTLEKQEIESILYPILEKILGNPYMDQIQNFMKNTKYKKGAYVGGITCYDRVGDRAQNLRFELTNVQNYMGAYFAGHEYQHGLLLERRTPYNAIYGNIHYHELPSMFVEKVISQYIEDEVGEKGFQNKMEHIRFCDDYDNAFMPTIPSIQSPDSFLVEYFAHHQGATYIISNMYATRLFELYRENPNLVLKEYRRFLNGDMSIPDLLEYFGISIKDNDTYFGYQKRLESHKNFYI